LPLAKSSYDEIGYNPINGGACEAEDFERYLKSSFGRAFEKEYFQDPVARHQQFDDRRNFRSFY
jgi:hypothetical protein|tara:strand:+ start:785 stop:976 length:192 start_codon:yes stop_codon:yes gene_type:complete